MGLKVRIERLEAEAGRNEDIFDVDLGDGRIVQLARLQIREVLSEIEGAGTGPGPATLDSRLAQ
jgi:hypothetical protein